MEYEFHFQIVLKLSQGRLTVKNGNIGKLSFS